jgi:putative membrane protein
VKNVFRIFKRDVKRLFTVPAAWVIVVGLCITPALYAWFNIVGFWDPYGNTQSISVAVANEDSGASSDLTGKVDIGTQIVNTLRKNDKIGWKFVDADEAHTEVNSGKSYAAIIIPSDFSKNLVSIVSGDFKRPKLEYYVNEKLNAIAPKVTDTGASTIDNQVNATFVATVSAVVTNDLKDTLGKATSKLESTRTDVGATLEESRAKVVKAQKALTTMADDIDGSRGKVSQIKKTLDSTSSALKNARTLASQTAPLLNEVSKESTSFSSTALATLGKGSTLISSISRTSDAAVTDLTGTLLKEQGKVGGALSTVQSIADSNRQIVSNLTDITNEFVVGDTRARILAVLTDLKEQNAKNSELISEVVKVNDGVGDTVSGVSDTADALTSSVTATTAAGGKLSSDFSKSTLPALTSDLSSLSVSSGQMAGVLNSQIGLVSESMGMLGQLDSTLKEAANALNSSASSVGTIADDLDTASTDVTALGTSAMWKNLLSVSDIDASAIAKNLSAPAKLQQKTLYPVATYGSAMAPLFTNLSLWIGAFVLVVILKLEVDREGIASLTSTQSYMGRWLLMALFSAAQALIVCIGDLIIGVQTVNPVAFVATGVVTALAYLSIVYALSKSFAHVGKGICVLLVMVQIPGASGLYPIEMMPGFFHALYPLLPFTYGIDAMRETIGGYYDGHYAIALGKLGIFVALAFIVGLAARRYLVNVNKMFADELDQTEIFVGEKAEVGERSYRLTHIIQALVDKDEYKQDMIERAHRFSTNYSTMRRGAFIVGFVVPIILGVISSLNWSTKPLVLGLWVAWVLLIIGFLVTIEYIRDSIRSQVSLGNMPESDIRRMLKAHYSHRGHERGRFRINLHRRRSRLSSRKAAASANEASGIETLEALANASQNSTAPNTDERTQGKGGAR